MMIASLVLEFYLPGCSSLKEKRIILNSVKDRLRNRFNVAFCETGFQDKWQRSELCVVTVANTSKRLDKILQSVISFLDSDPRAVCTNIERTYL
ncbi:MAG TPA: DUF503 domain-containing protein [Candidatus Krumholzibacteriaceae bacterium]|nr:DUF503 domain-containing protein [Candidatus Krumholzibacteriaceae bacterium]